MMRKDRKKNHTTNIITLHGMDLGDKIRIIGRGSYRLPSLLSPFQGSPSCRQSPKRTTRTQAGDDSPCSRRNENTAAVMRQPHNPKSVRLPHRGRREPTYRQGFTPPAFFIVTLSGFPHAAKVLKGRPELKQATTVPACNGMETRFPDENDKKGGPQKQRPPFLDLIRLVLYHSRIANAHIHGFRIANSEERGGWVTHSVHAPPANFFARLARNGTKVSSETRSVLPGQIVHSSVGWGSSGSNRPNRSKGTSRGSGRPPCRANSTSSRRSRRHR